MNRTFPLPTRPLLTRRRALSLGVAGGFLASAPVLWPPCGCAFAAMPAEMTLKEVAPGLHVFSAPYELVGPGNGGAIANMAVVIGDDAAAIIDTGNSRLAGLRFAAAVKAVTDRPVRYVINTHMHPDHVLGNAAFVGADVRFVGHHKLPRALAARQDTYLDQVRRLLGAEGEGTQIVLPELLVEDRLTLDLGNRVLELEAHPTAHTDNDLSVRDARTGAWLLGDLLFVGHVPTLDGSLQGWLTVLEGLKKREASTAIPGHGPASVDWPNGGEAEWTYLDTLRTEVRRLIAEGVQMGKASEIAGRSQAGKWALFDEFAARNAIAAYHEFEWE
ncbi:quinoprotein relay system zinc metallohydrolase 2 [Ancylobacter sp. 6x-1]|uniref:Quinoprotein relay system zinc metallohydrolase 2 n=1 Tax=Ancylobacter crimeensis TaxID=2579147 RepID=A0ABT0D8L0_9HYPH|nr:quinoprotein relay system zinc metallohydrolase 2 [Ancylobacter crimeensis]MCK0196285.1 quinoprotein relay system zinc metallohydrolase 2 [Ancylobacter crimeensis]